MFKTPPSTIRGFISNIDINDPILILVTFTCLGRERSCKYRLQTYRGGQGGSHLLFNSQVSRELGGRSSTRAVQRQQAMALPLNHTSPRPVSAHSGNLRLGEKEETPAQRSHAIAQTVIRAGHWAKDPFPSSVPYGWGSPEPQIQMCSWRPDRQIGIPNPTARERPGEMLSPDGANPGHDPCPALPAAAG